MSVSSRVWAAAAAFLVGVPPVQPAIVADSWYVTAAEGTIRSTVFVNAAAVDAQGTLYVAGRLLRMSPGGGFEAVVFRLRPGEDGHGVARMFFRGSGDEEVTGIAVDAAGDLYVAGVTNSPDFPVTNALQPVRPGGATDAFVVKLRWGSGVIYSTYLGGTGADRATGIAVDAAGHAYVTGTSVSSAGFPIQNAIQPGPSDAAGDVFVTKLAPAGNELVYSTFLGGSNADEGRAIAVDSAGRAHVAGRTQSGWDASCGCTPFPTLRPLQAHRGGWDGFVTTLAADGSELVASTFLGGAANDEARGIAIDAAGSRYVTGTTLSDDFPTSRPFQAARRGDQDAFLAKLDSEGDALVYSTYLGGSGLDTANAVAVDAAGAAYITGMATALDFPWRRSLGYTRTMGEGDTYGMRFLPDGSGPDYSTRLGNNRYRDEGTGVAVLGDAAYFSGWGMDFDVEGTVLRAFKLVPSERLEQDHASIAYEGAWELDTMAGWSGGSALVSPQPGSRATLQFTGSAFTWVGGKSPVGGIAAIYVDGTLAGTVDLYPGPGDPVEGYRDEGLFHWRGADGPHTVSIEVTGSNHQSSSGHSVWVDAFEIVRGALAPTPTPTPTSAPVPALRIEQDDPAVTRTGTWYPHGSGVHSGGSAVLSMTAGDTTSVTFQGTGIQWVGVKEPSGGQARIRIDATTYTGIDTFSAVEQTQVPIWMVGGLTPGTHTMTITVEGRRHAASDGEWVWVDAFDVFDESPTPTPTPTPTPSPTATPTGSPTTPPSTTRVEQNATGVVYAGTWYTHVGGHSGGSAALAMEQGHRATLTFEGTGVRWVGIKEPWSGIARVYVDGVLQATVDTYAATEQRQVVLYARSDLAPGTHTIAIEATGGNHPASGGAWIWVDAFDVTSGGGAPTATPTVGPTPTATSGPTPTPTPTPTTQTIQETDARVVKTGPWYPHTHSVHSGGSAITALDAGAAAELTFTGTGVRWIGLRDSWSGIARVYVDGAPRGTLDTYSAMEQTRTVIFSATDLSPGSHSIRIEATGERGPDSGNASIWVDAFEVLP